MQKKIDYKLLKKCIETYEFAVERYNYFVVEDNLNLPEISEKDLIKFLKKQKKNKFPIEQIYSQKEHEPKQIECGSIEGTYYEIWTNGCYPWVKVLPLMFKEHFDQFAALVRMPKTRGLKHRARNLKCDFPFYVWEYNTSEDYWGGGSSYGYDPSYRHDIYEIFEDICNFVFQWMLTKEDKETGKLYIAKEK